MSSLISSQRIDGLALLFTALIALFLVAPPAHAASAAEIDRVINQTLEAFQRIDGAKAFLAIEQQWTDTSFRAR